MRLFSAAGCPFAQRTRALLQLLDTPYELVEVDLSNKSGEFLALSPTGAVPVLDDGGFVVFESAVINEYLAEKLGWKEAFGEDVQQRARERLAMRRFDDFVVPLFYRSLGDPSAIAQSATLRRELAVIAGAVAGRAPAGLIGLHLATHFVRWEWVAAGGVAMRGLREALGGYVDAAMGQASIQATNPDREKTTALLRQRFKVP
ncbi:MAG: glutathione S-transferase N-terminal domain-containing protein [Myxococcaceae bacterium]|nr:glutathione S-transferase N-terminal domain-containing protein [Myxococcaceae bacterium]